jgi:hypothetical protein
LLRSDRRGLLTSCSPCILHKDSVQKAGQPSWEANKKPAKPCAERVLYFLENGGRYWDRTSDPCRVKEGFGVNRSSLKF